MVVGYAAFSTKLNISGTAGTTSKWNVLITNVTTEQIVGTATNDEGSPTYDNTNGLTASFNADLKSPGDSITYKITVANQGNIDAVLSSLTLPDSTNEAINFEPSGFGVDENGKYQSEVLKAGESDDLYIKVEYNSDITSQPTTLTESYTVTLDFEQYVGGSVEPTQTITTEDLKLLAVTSGDGLYADSYEEGRYIYAGADPDNYITFNGEEAGWRILSVEADGTLKIMRNTALSDSPVFDTEGL